MFRFAFFSSSFVESVREHTPRITQPSSALRIIIICSMHKVQHAVCRKFEYIVLFVAHLVYVIELSQSIYLPILFLSFCSSSLYVTDFECRTIFFRFGHFLHVAFFSVSRNTRFIHFYCNCCSIAV